MDWYIKIGIYLVSLMTSLFTLYQIDFNKFIRVSKKQLAIFIYIVLSIALGASIGSFLIGIGEAIISSTK